MKMFKLGMQPNFTGNCRATMVFYVDTVWVSERKQECHLVLYFELLWQ